jgi:hypothetical protein
MKTRCVFSTIDLPAARAAMQVAREAGIDDDDISLLIREDIEVEPTADHRQLQHHDFRPNAMRNVGFSGGTGLLLLGLIAVAVPPLCIKLAGVGAMALVAPARIMRTGAPADFKVPDVEVPSRKFEDEIAAGHVLVVIDGNVNQLPAVQYALVSSGAIPLPFDARMASS